MSKKLIYKFYLFKVIVIFSFPAIYHQLYALEPFFVDLEDYSFFLAALLQRPILY